MSTFLILVMIANLLLSAIGNVAAIMILDSITLVVVLIVEMENNENFN